MSGSAVNDLASLRSDQHLQVHLDPTALRPCGRLGTKSQMLKHRLSSSLLFFKWF